MENIKILCDRQDIVFIADAVRNKTGSSQELTLGDIAASIDGIETGVELPTLSNEGSASDLLSGKQLIDGDGNIVTGTIATKTASNLTASGATVTVPAGYYASQATKSVGTATQATPSITVNASGLITATATQIAGYVSAGTKTATKQLTTQAAKTITPTKSSQTAVDKDVYTTGAVTVAAIPSTYVQPNGTLNVTTNGIHDVKNYASVSVSVASGGGNTSVEDSLVTRTVSNYTNNRVTSIGSYAFYKYASLTTASFPNATSIGSYAFYSCYSLTTASFPKATRIGSYAFYGCSGLITASFPNATSISGSAFCRCSSLTTASFPKATTINDYAFSGCYSLTTASFPSATNIGYYAFCGCSRLTTASFPKATTINGYAFFGCTSLTTASFPNATSIGSYAFSGCYNLKSLYLTGSSVCKLSASNAFSSTPIGGYSASARTYGSIYVPTSLLTSYKTATNWTYFSSRFVGI